MSIYKKKILTLLYLTLFCIISFFLTTDTKADSIGSWTATSSLPTQLASQASIVYNNKIYLFGGATTSLIPTALYSTISSSGDITKWNDLSSTPPAAYYQASALKDNIVYLLGGTTSPNIIQDNVYIGDINNEGDINTWQNSPDVLPFPDQLGEALVVNNRLYFAGGENSSGEIQDKIFFADISNDGNLSTWKDAGALPLPLKAFSMLKDKNGNIIIIGGQTTGNITESSVYKASINTTGSVSNWQALSNIPQVLHSQGAVISGDTIIVVGGVTIDQSESPTNKVFYSTLQSNGTLTPWIQSSDSLPYSTCCGTLNFMNGYLYWVGGYNTDVGYTNQVFFTKITIANFHLSVPYYNQTSSPWGGSEYDHSKALGFTPYTMSRWGCAVTSAAMLLNYYGMKQFVDGSTINPGSLNQWLNNNNGYEYGTSSDGNYSYINFAKVGSLTEQLYNANKSTTKLEWTPYVGHTSTTDALIDTDLANNSPDIIQVKSASTSSHFVVTTGKNDTTYTINDPFWNVADLASFGNTYTMLDRFVPSHTNLSYITIVVNPSVQILVTNSQNQKTGKIYTNNVLSSYNQIPNALYQFEQPISNPGATNNPTNLGTGVNSFLLPKPDNGSYQITLSSNHPATFTVNLETFQTDGTTKLSTYLGSVGLGNQKTFVLDFNQTQDATSNENVTILSTLNDISDLYQLKLINLSLYAALTATLQNAMNDQKSHMNTAEKAIIKADDTMISQQKKVGNITQNTYDILHADFLALENIQNI